MLVTSNLETNEDPARWSDMKITFDRHASKLSEILWESLERILRIMKDILTGAIPGFFVHQNA